MSSTSRRYTLQPPIRSTDNRRPIPRGNVTSRPRTSSRIRYENDDPWVRELLNREIDFSQLVGERPSIEVVPVRSNSRPTTRPRTVGLIPERKPRRNVSYPPRSSDSSSSRTWIIDQANNSIPHKPRRHTLHRNRIDEEESLIRDPKQPSRPKPKPLKRKEEPARQSKSVWKLFNGKEKRNIAIYIVGIMLYKFGLEAFNGSIVSLATNRYDRDAFQSGGSARTFEKVGLLVGLNQACQCIGSILIAPLVKRWPTRSVLAVSIFLFALLAALLMIIDAATGGKIKPSNFQPMYENDYRYYGKYPTSVIIPVYCLTGVAYGMVELIRRIIPQNIVGSNEEKLQRMDALVHVFYEIAGVSGALTTGLLLIPRLGNNYAFLITPILFTLAAVVWFFINALGDKSDASTDEVPGGNVKGNYFQALLKGFVLFGQSVYLGGKIIFSERKYFWLFPCYSLTLYIHRYLENGIAPQIAKRYLNNSEWSQIIVGGSNFGELCGALTVFLFTRRVRSPVVWLRLDCLLLLIAWYIPFYNPSSISIKHAWIIAATFFPFGFGSAGDDVSLNAHIQSVLGEAESKNADVSSLGAVVAFLYSSYIILYAVCNPLLGKYIDSVYNTKQTVRPAFIYTVGVQTTVISLLIAISTFIPKNSLKFNPSLK